VAKKVLDHAKPEAAEAASDERKPVADSKSGRRAVLFLILFVVFVVIVFLGPPIYRNWQAQRTLQANTYNGFQFVQMRDGEVTLWVTRIQKGAQPYNIPFYYHPRDTESVALEPGITNRFLSPDKPARVYVTIDPEASSTPVLAGVEFARILGYKYNLLNIDTRSAFQRAPPDNDSNVVVMTCADATANVTVISMDLGQNDIIYRDTQNPNCIRVQYMTENESVRVADRFAYGLLRIMPG